MTYLPRIADEELTELLMTAGGVLIEGPRACGKTAMASQVAASEIRMDADPHVQDAIAIDPGLLLDGKTPRLIDEWQAEPIIWNHVRRAIDDRAGRGHFILTGSAVPPDDITRHTGAGRIIRLRLRPMSLFELGHTTGQISLKDILNGETVPSLVAALAVPDIAELVCIGGWPGHLRLSADRARRINQAYLEEICRTDISRTDGVRRDPARVARFLRSLARNTATCASLATLARDVADGIDRTGPPLKNNTASEYLTALKRLMILEDQPPWGPHLRSRSRQRQSVKRHFVDPSLAAAALRATPEHLLRDLGWFGLLFESMAIRDLRVYAQALGGRLYHYRDNTGLEVDAIVDIAPGRWAAFEVKLGAGWVDEAARTLLKFADRVDTDRCGEPAALGVIVGSDYGYQRPDGVSVIPLAALGP